jgi:protein TonB
MNRYLAQTIRYPDEAREAGIGGKILVDFFVHEDGTIETLKTHGHDVSLCKEAIRAIKAMPKWKPGKVDDKPVKVSFTQPVVFKLE